MSSPSRSRLLLAVSLALVLLAGAARPALAGPSSGRVGRARAQAALVKKGKRPPGRLARWRKRLVKGIGVALLGYTLLGPIAFVANKAAVNKSADRTVVFTSGSFDGMGLHIPELPKLASTTTPEARVDPKTGMVVRAGDTPGQQPASKPPGERWRDSDKVTFGDRVATALVDWAMIPPVVLGETLRGNRVEWHSGASADAIGARLSRGQHKNVRFIGHGRTGSFAAAGGQNFTVTDVRRLGIAKTDGEVVQHSCGGGACRESLGASLTTRADRVQEYADTVSWQQLTKPWLRTLDDAARSVTGRPPTDLADR
ncbi:MAG: hypothetical protein KC503_43215 [Myxococcales bacterium]|nr:hypothetical protein [Myxococcales bacterium]